MQVVNGCLHKLEIDGLLSGGVLILMAHPRRYHIIKCLEDPPSVLVF